MERLKLKKKKLLMVSLRKGERSEEIRKPERRKMKGGNFSGFIFDFFLVISVY